MKKKQAIEIDVKKEDNKLTEENNFIKRNKYKKIKRICLLVILALSVYAIIFWSFFYIIIIRRPKYTINYKNILSDDTYKLYYENKKNKIKYYTNCYNKITVYEERLLHKKKSGELKDFIKQGKLNKLLNQTMNRKVYYNDGLQTEYNFTEEDTNISIYRCANKNGNIHYLIASPGMTTFYECNKDISNN